MVLHSASAGRRCHSLTVYRAHTALLSSSVRILLSPVTVYRAPALPFVVEEEEEMIEEQFHIVL